MTTAITNQEMATPPNRVPVLNRPNMVSVGTIAFLAQELMFFAGLFAMYFTSRANGMTTGDWEKQTEYLNVMFGLIITIVLVLSSVTSQMGVFAAERGDVYGLRRWFSVTIGLGVVFLGLVAFEWFEMVSHGVTPQASVYGSVFYIITGFHMAHVTALHHRLHRGDVARCQVEVHVSAGYCRDGDFLLLALRRRHLDWRLCHPVPRSVMRLARGTRGKTPRIRLTVA